ncbi:MAG: NAD(P)H-quinone oxidoreductase [Mesorhizobium sp.]|uniref:NAD(P)H-quinone oxidoreductase n=2 Tax=unclassified Mesorhizobium TaxID=325217 RepID=UPI000FE61D61|nr:NAD(P)H-quinone oxidoreductase [Mesorhizobium sp.]RWC86335.1 MAG: NAD(P)H-quinone oxidoreductase [Mesorhizobium sp.]TIT68329.1 MAG: NAD(P)H-quinone oxidoreductase [Mesorhizobium sp.]
MRAIVYEEFGAAEVLHVAEVPVPHIRPTDLLVKVAAAGVNRADLLQRTGFYGAQHFGESPLLGLEVAGEVIALGDAVTDVEIGARVMAIVGGGGYGEIARVDRAMAAPIPESMPFHEAAAVMESFVTAVEAVSNLAQINTGQKVLVHSAAGGIGSAAVQVAHSLGAVVYATASASRHDDVLSIGADVVIDYRTGDFEAEIAARTGGTGVDAVIDFVGGDYLAKNLRSLRPGGVLVQVGILSGQNDAVIPLNLVLHNHLRLVGTVMKSRTAAEKRAMVQRFAALALPLFAAGRLRPLIDHVFPLAEAADAHRRMEAGGGFGKIVLTL